MDRGKSILKSNEEGGDEGIASRGKSSSCYNGLIDRSKIRVLLCDANVQSSREVFALLHRYSYQVTPVWSARETVDVLDSKGSGHFDIILADVGLVMANSGQMIRHISRVKEYQHIPIIMLSTEDEIPATIKGLRLGAADYFVKPLHSSQLSNLWMHAGTRKS